MPITYKCPSCGAAMEFNAATGKLHCNQCSTDFDVKDYETRYGEQYNFRGTGNYTIFHCQSCGAELITDEYTSATICGFCGNPSLVGSRLDGEFSPSLIIPFKYDKTAATNEFKQWVRKGLFTPRTLMLNSTIEKLSGIYVPFWLYDMNATDYMTGDATRSHRVDHPSYYEIITEHFDVMRDVEADFSRIPADASEKMPDGIMDKLEPFDYRELLPFAMPYLSGYLSERYNYTAEDMENRVVARANKYISDIAVSSVKGYEHVSVLSNTPASHSTQSLYALLPVWMLHYRYNGKDYQFFLNGQTGKIVADRPISNLRRGICFAGVFAATFIITLIGGVLLW